MSATELDDMTPEQETAVDAFRADLATLEAGITQRQWLLITTRLDRRRDQINEDGNLRLLALAWVRGVRDHGGARWDDLLELTDAEILAAHHWPAHLFPDDGTATDPAPQ